MKKKKSAKCTLCLLLITTIEKKQGLVVLLLFLLLPTRMLGDAILNTEPKRSHGHPNILALPQLLPSAHLTLSAKLEDSKQVEENK